jgi:polar amino acid transport system substrate-binding protein
MLSAMVSRFRPALLGTVTLLVVAALTACIPADEPANTAPTAAPVNATSLPPECAKTQLRTKTPGKLTIATDNPAYPPWFVDNKPENGQGFEGAVAAALAEKLGYAQAEVAWKRVTFDKAIAPGPKDFDLDINQFSITDARRQAVDFSAPYYNVRQVVIALRTNKIANAKNFGDLKDAKLGAQVNTTSYQMITTVLRPNSQPSVFNSNDDAKKALQNGSIDGLVVDLPTGFFMTSAEIENSKVVGQLPLAVAQPEQFGLVLDKGSPLTACVSRAIEALRAGKTLEGLEKQWLGQVAGAPDLA